MTHPPHEIGACALKLVRAAEALEKSLARERKLRTALERITKVETTECDEGGLRCMTNRKPEHFCRLCIAEGALMDLPNG